MVLMNSACLMRESFRRQAATGVVFYFKTAPRRGASLSFAGVARS